MVPQRGLILFHYNYTDVIIDQGDKQSETASLCGNDKRTPHNINSQEPIRRKQRVITNYSQSHHCKTTSWLLNSLRAELYFNHNLQRPSNISGSETQLWGRGFLRITGLQDGIHWGTRQEYIWKALRGQRTGWNLHRSGGLFLEKSRMAGDQRWVGGTGQSFTQRCNLSTQVPKTYRSKFATVTRPSISRPFSSLSHYNQGDHLQLAF